MTDQLGALNAILSYKVANLKCKSWSFRWERGTRKLVDGYIRFDRPITTVEKLAVMDAIALCFAGGSFEGQRKQNNTVITFFQE